MGAFFLIWCGQLVSLIGSALTSFALGVWLYQMAETVALPLASVLAGPLADHIFEPLMTQDSFLASNIGQIIGVGKGRGIGLLFIVMGLLMMLITFLAYYYRPLRLVEDDLPDAIG